MTFDELREEGYDFTITGRMFEVRFVGKRVKVDIEAVTAEFVNHSMSKMKDDFMEALLYGKSMTTGRFTSAAPKIQNLPRAAGKAAALASAYGSGTVFSNKFFTVHDELQHRFVPETVVRGFVDQGWDHRKRIGPPRPMNKKQVMEMCMRAATAHFVKRQLQR